jgi:muconolactone D-isomerase
MQFMASIHLDTDHHREDIERLLPAEQVRVRELNEQGNLEALYVPDGLGAPGNLWAVFDADSDQALQAVLESLPLFPYMQLDVTPLRSLEARR